MCYLAMVNPILEYASIVWSPHTNSNMHKLKMVQRRAGPVSTVIKNIDFVIQILWVELIEYVVSEILMVHYTE